MMFIFGMQMMVQAQYNVFGDQMMPFIFGMVRSPRFEVLWCLPFIAMSRLHERMVSLSILGRFGPRRDRLAERLVKFRERGPSAATAGRTRPRDASRRVAGVAAVPGRS